ncbi:hypothetical protein Tcan_00638, partial [Toxocara canis]
GDHCNEHWLPLNTITQSFFQLSLFIHLLRNETTPFVDSPFYCTSCNCHPIHSNEVIQFIPAASPWQLDIISKIYVPWALDTFESVCSPHIKLGDYRKAKR